MSVPHLSAIEAAFTRDVADSRHLLGVRTGLVGVLLLAWVLGVIGITNEGYVSLHGDMGKHLMNGAYALDVATDRPFSSLDTFLEYSRLYYARYPELSLGHHPILLPMMEVPMFALFGISVTSARLVPLLALLLSVAYLYKLANDIYGLPTAVFASAFLATSPLVISLTRAVMSEMPTVALVLASAYYFHRFCHTQRRSALVAFVVTAVLSVYSKQLAIFVFPAFIVPGLAHLGIRRLFRRDVLLAIVAIIALSAPLVVLTAKMSPVAVQMIGVGSHLANFKMSDLVRLALTEQFSLPVLLLAACGVTLAIVNRDRRALFFVAWVVGVFVGLIVAGILEPPRYTIYWVPAISVLAASCAAVRRGPLADRVILVVLVSAVAFQTWIAAEPKGIVGAEGYEEAARFVVESNPGPSVMFSGDVDTGFFTFFVRKHDRARQLIVLRSDKVLTTSQMGRPSVEDRIDRPEQVDEVLHKFGTRYVVIEDRPSRSRVLEWLRDELHTSKFIERRRIPIGTTDVRLKGTSLVVYEFTDPTPADRNAILDMHLPLVGRSVTVKLSDLIDRKYLR
jgi:hypothetical protein